MSKVTVRIRPGVDHADSKAWAEELASLERRWIERNGFPVIGTGSDFEVHDEGVWDVLGSELGVHATTRISPYDDEERRVTAYARVEATSSEREEFHYPERFVRRYVVDPYVLVEDQITGRKTEALQRVLLGDLTELVGAE
jgi:hypothetical protein